MPTAEEAQQEARDRSTQVLSSWIKLRQILERYEEVLRKRWTKKGKLQRTSIILKAWPRMSPTHRPDYEALRKEGPQSMSQGTRFKEAYMWPYMNVEDLVRGKTLLLFLNSRGRNPPHMFAHADFAAMHLGHVSGAVMPAFLNLHTMFLEGDTVETYGRLVSWDDDDDAMEKMINGIGHGPGEGLLILEIQQRTLKFLLECCYGILHDVDAKSIINEAVKPEPPALRDGLEYPTLASIAAEAPYRLPAQLDFNRLKALVSARCGAAEDHIRGLREDPGYFAEAIGDWSEHRQERLRDTNNARHPILDTPFFWQRVISNTILYAYGGLIVWNILHEQITHLATLQQKYSESISPQSTIT